MNDVKAILDRIRKRYDGMIPVGPTTVKEDIGTLLAIVEKAGEMRAAAYNMAWPLASRWDEEVVSRCWYCDEPVTTPYTEMKHLPDCRRAAVVSAIAAFDAAVGRR